MNSCIGFVKRVASMRCECKPNLWMRGKPVLRKTSDCLTCEARKVLAAHNKNLKTKRVARTRQFELPHV